MKRQIINASTELERSNLSFDFSWRDDYDWSTIEDIAWEALEPYEVLGLDIISMTEQYDGYDHEYPNVSQCNVTFEHDDYDYTTAASVEDKIEFKLAECLARNGMALEGLSFESID